MAKEENKEIKEIEEHMKFHTAMAEYKTKIIEKEAEAHTEYNDNK